MQSDRRSQVKFRRIILVALLLVTIPALTSCDLFGNSKERERAEYERQLEYFKQVQEANQKAQEDYNERVKEGLEQWAEEYQEWQEAQTQQNIEQVQQQQASQ
jgi:DNA phosphorothioation-dependent restriction protein DptG